MGGFLEFVAKLVGLFFVVVIAYWLCTGAMRRRSVNDPLRGTVAARRLRRLVAARWFVYFAAVAALAVHYGFRFGPVDATQYYLVKNLFGVALFLPVMLVLCAVSIALAPSGRRGAAFARLWRGFGLLSGPVSVVIGALLLLGGYFYIIQGDLPWKLDHIPVVGQILGGIFYLIYILPLFLVGLCVPIAVIVSMFNIYAVHPLLPPLCAPWLVLASVFGQRTAASIDPDAAGGLINVTGAVEVALSVLSVAAVSVLCVFEYRITRDELGVSLRSGPLEFEPAEPRDPVADPPAPA